MDDIPAGREVRDELLISDPTPVDSVDKMWVSAGHGAIKACTRDENVTSPTPNNTRTIRAGPI